MALPCGEIRLRENGSAGGHHGMESVIEAFGTESIPRIRIGIGEPPKEEAIDYVLGKPKPDEAEALAQAVDNAAKALRDIELRGLPYAMSVYNGLRQKE
jgi:PTH1 family peptidyl-tRNA hydrolase